MSSIKLRAKEKNGAIEVKALIKHPMATGLRKDKKTGKIIPAHFIKEVIATANNKEVMMINWNISIATNPFLSFSYAGKKGDKVKLTWRDNQDKSDSLEVTVK